ncbi:MAG: membrane protein insertase YidC, partial [Thermoanaerobaculia bacterium]
MEKRIFAAIGLSIAFLWLWAAVAPRIFPQLAKPQPPKQTGTSTSGTSPAEAGATSTSAKSTTATTVTTSAPAPTSTTTPSIAPAPVATPVAASAVEFTAVETDDYIARLSNRGAQLVSFQLKNYKRKDGTLVELVKSRPAGAADFPFAIEARSAEVSRRLNTALYQVNDWTDAKTRVVEYRYVATDGLSATKTFRLGPDFLFDFNISAQPADGYRIIVGPGIRNIDPKATEGQAALLA